MIQIKMNSAQGALDRAKKTYDERAREYRTSCMSVAEQGQAAMTAVQADFDRVNQEAKQLDYMSNFIINQLEQAVNGQQTLDSLAQMAVAQASQVQAEIDTLKSQVRTERRRFLDADPTAPTAVAGMYFTREPDNQVLIAFMACYGAFLLFVGIMIIQNLVPIPFFDRMSSTDRIKFVGTLWVVALVMGYIGFYMFT